MPSATLHTPNKLMQSIMILRSLEDSVSRAYVAHVAAPSEQTLLALGHSLHRLEAAIEATESMTNELEVGTMPTPHAVKDLTVPLQAA